MNNIEQHQCDLRTAIEVIYIVTEYVIFIRTDYGTRIMSTPSLPGSLAHLAQLIVCIKVELILFSHRRILGHILSCTLLTTLCIS